MAKGNKGDRRGNKNTSKTEKAPAQQQTNSTTASSEAVVYEPSTVQVEATPSVTQTLLNPPEVLIDNSKKQEVELNLSDSIAIPIFDSQVRNLDISDEVHIPINSSIDKPILEIPQQSLEQPTVQIVEVRQNKIIKQQDVKMVSTTRQEIEKIDHMDSLNPYQSSSTVQETIQPQSAQKIVLEAAPSVEPEHPVLVANATLAFTSDELHNTLERASISAQLSERKEVIAEDESKAAMITQVIKSEVVVERINEDEQKDTEKESEVSVPQVKQQTVELPIEEIVAQKPIQACSETVKSDISERKPQIADANILGQAIQIGQQKSAEFEVPPHPPALSHQSGLSESFSEHQTTFTSQGPLLEQNSSPSPPKFINQVIDARRQIHHQPIPEGSDNEKSEKNSKSSRTIKRISSSQRSSKGKIQEELVQDPISNQAQVRPVVGEIVSSDQSLVASNQSSVRSMVVRRHQQDRLGQQNRGPAAEPLLIIRNDVLRIEPQSRTGNLWTLILGVAAAVAIGFAVLKLKR